MDFLKDVALLTDRDIEQEKPCVKLMTIHSAKGLEFPCVYIVGLEENIFPSPQSVDSIRKLEEERRLFYVAITRAEKHCIMTYAKMRYRYGKMEFSSPSRFLRDIDSDLLETGRPSSKNSLPPRRQPVSVVPSFRESRNLTPIRQQPSSFNPQPSDIIPHTSSISHHTSSIIHHTSSALFSVGDAVVHERFGDGIVTAIEGSGDSQKAIVNFTYSGTKQLLLKFAKLKKK